jgi:hypothetical protein
MVKKRLTEFLITLLERLSYDLLLLVVTFLKKLSIYEENMVQVGIRMRMRMMMMMIMMMMMMMMMMMTSYDLLLLVVTFLKKLSIYEENMVQVGRRRRRRRRMVMTVVVVMMMIMIISRVVVLLRIIVLLFPLQQMRESDVVPKLVRIIPCSHDRLVSITSSDDYDDEENLLLLCSMRLTRILLEWHLSNDRCGSRTWCRSWFTSSPAATTNWCQSRQVTTMTMRRICFYPVLYD